MRISVSSPGKIHLTSAHVVVYGKPALLSTINLRTEVKLSTNTKTNKIKLISRVLKTETEISAEDAINDLAYAQRVWQEFAQEKNITLLKKLFNKPLQLTIYAVAQALTSLKQKPGGLTLEIDSQIPAGSNLGSSAALSASIIGSLFLHFGQNLNKEKINDLVFETEKLIHGFPSGGDNTAVVFGGLLWYRKETGFLNLYKNLSVKANDNFLIINSGKPNETTGEMVVKVKKLVNKRPKYFQRIFSLMEEQKKEFLTAFWENNLLQMKEIMTRDERLLEKLGVVSLSTKELIRDLEKLGTAVGVSGAGGYQNRSGALVVLTNDKAPVIEYTKKINLKYYDALLGVEGLRSEND